jgi:hypothetical protein
MANPVIAEILRQGRNQPRRRVLAALVTGRVESNFKNLSGGDADSAGWRQERASLYRNPTNLKASVRRFYREAAKLDRGQKVGELAADVQRPAAQFRGRYAQHVGEARKLLGSGGGGGGGSTSTTTTRLGGPGSAVDVAAALAQQAPTPQRTITAPALPDVLTPQGYTPVVTQAPAEPQADLRSALAQIAQDKLPSVTTSTTTSRSGGGGGGVPKSGSQIKELFWQGKGGIDIKNGKRVPQGFVSGHTDHVHVAAGPKTTVRLGKVAQSMGLHVGENPHFGGVHPVHVQGSNHYKGEAIDVSGNPELMRRFAKRVARYQRRRGR